MSKKRLIPKLQLSSSSFDPNHLVVVNTKLFDKLIEIGDPVSQSKIFQDQGADELIFLNIDRKIRNIDGLCSVISRISEEVFMPLSVGGGVRNEEDFRKLLKSGADKICINTAALDNPEFISSSAEKYGSQCVVVSIDYKLNNQNEFKVYSNLGKIETKWAPIDWARNCVNLGAGELLFTSIDRDGTKTGLDIELLRNITKELNIPVIISGGCGLASHFSDGYLLAGADGVAAGTFFAHRDQNFMQTRSHIKNSGVNIRIHS